MPIYTRRGDRGTTRIYGGKNIRKTDSRIRALGSLDELNSHFGLILAQLTDRKWRGERAKLSRLQQDLFEIGSEIAASNAADAPFKLRKSSITRLERWIDEYWKKLPPLANFIFPGGSRGGAQAHVCRTVARRAELAVVALSEEEQINPNILSYLNRLSDFLLALARWVNKLEGVEDVIWSSASTSLSASRMASAKEKS